MVLRQSKAREWGNNWEKGMDGEIFLREKANYVWESFFQRFLLIYLTSQGRNMIFVFIFKRFYKNKIYKL